MKTALGLLLLLLLCWWLLYQPSEPTAPVSSPNTVTRVDHTPIQKKPPTATQKPTITQNQEQANPTEPTPNKATKDQPQTYLQLYRDFRLAERCRRIFEQLNQHGSSYDFVQAYADRHQTGETVNQVTPNGLQLTVYESFVADCLQLEAKVTKDLPMQSQDPSNRKVLWLENHLSEQLLETTANTTKEKALKKLRQLDRPWDEQWQTLIKLSQGTLDDSDPAVLNIKQQIEDLRHTNRQQRQLLGDAYTSEILAEFSAKIQALYQQLQTLTQYDTAARNKALDEVNTLTAQISAYLHQQDADLFYEAAALLGDNRNHRMLNSHVGNRHFKGALLHRLAIPYVTTGKQLQQQTGQYGSRNFYAVSPHAHHLLLCSLGEDCSASSAIMQDYCIGISRAHGYADACNKDLAAFYFEGFLSPNQQADVLKMFDQLVGIYGP